MEKTCRTCLRSPEILLPLFDDHQLSEKIETITSVQISKTDNLPTEICAECVININLAYNFRRVVINSDRELKRRITTSSIQNDIVDSKKDEVPLIQIDIKLESELLTEEQFLQENVCDILENTESEAVETQMKTENTSQIQMENITLQPQTNKPKVSLPTSVSYKTQPLFRGIMHRNRSYKCKACDFATPYSSKFSNHKRSHSVPKSVCNICGKTVRADNFKKHLSIHTEPPVACKECGKFCKNTESLRSHVLIHKGLEITCEYCGQIFKFRGGYKRHVYKKHTVGASKNAKCHLCDKKFHDTTDLKKHLRSHTGERPFLCQYCKKGFSSTHALKTHIRQHTNERPYKCDLCPMAFPQKVSLRTHLKSKHSVVLKQTP